jgi:hypothetical protein
MDGKSGVGIILNAMCPTRGSGMEASYEFYLRLLNTGKDKIKFLKNSMV